MLPNCAARPIGADVSGGRRASRDIVKPSRDVAIVTLKPPPNAAIRFRRGQYISLVGDDGRLHAFSIANAPRADGTLELHIGRIPNGRFTTHVHERMRPRDILRFEGPFGEFGFSDAHARSARRSLSPAAQESRRSRRCSKRSNGGTQPRSMHLYWGSRRREGLYAIDELSRRKPACG